MESGQWGRLLPLLLLLAAFVAPADFAPLDWNEDEPGCFHMMQHYNNGDQIVTDEPCLNCTCRNNMLMCFLKVCPYVMPLAKGCSMDKQPGDCCATVTCEQVPVPIMQMLGMMTQTAATTPAPSGEIHPVDVGDAGCQVDGQYYADGAQVPSNPNEPCDVCYCIRNHTACVQQECTMRVPGCEPVFQAGICCPVRYVCDYQTTTLPPITTARPELASVGCTQDGVYYSDGDQIASEDPCQHCYCMHSEVKCAVQDCASPLDHADAQCSPVPPRPGQCCPDQYDCGGSSTATGSIPPGESTIDSEGPPSTGESISQAESTPGAEQTPSVSDGVTIETSEVAAVDEVQQPEGAIDETQQPDGESEEGDGGSGAEAAGGESDLVDSGGIVDALGDAIESSGDVPVLDGVGEVSEGPDGGEEILIPDGEVEEPQQVEGAGVEGSGAADATVPDEQTEAGDFQESVETLGEGLDASGDIVGPDDSGNIGAEEEASADQVIPTEHPSDGQDAGDYLDKPHEGAEIAVQGSGEESEIESSGEAIDDSSIPDTEVESIGATVDEGGITDTTDVEQDGGAPIGSETGPITGAEEYLESSGDHQTTEETPDQDDVVAETGDIPVDGSVSSGDIDDEPIGISILEEGSGIESTDGYPITVPEGVAVDSDEASGEGIDGSEVLSGSEATEDNIPGSETTGESAVEIPDEVFQSGSGADGGYPTDPNDGTSPIDAFPSEAVEEGASEESSGDDGNAITEGETTGNEIGGGEATVGTEITGTDTVGNEIPAEGASGSEIIPGDDDSGDQGSGEELLPITETGGSAPGSPTPALPQGPVGVITETAEATVDGGSEPTEAGEAEDGEQLEGTVVATEVPPTAAAPETGSQTSEVAAGLEDGKPDGAETGPTEQEAVGGEAGATTTLGIEQEVTTGPDAEDHAGEEEGVYPPGSEDQKPIDQSSDQDIAGEFPGTPVTDGILPVSETDSTGENIEEGSGLDAEEETVGQDSTPGSIIEPGSEESVASDTASTEQSGEQIDDVDDAISDIPGEDQGTEGSEILPDDAGEGSGASETGSIPAGTGTTDVVGDPALPVDKPGTAGQHDYQEGTPEEIEGTIDITGSPAFEFEQIAGSGNELEDDRPESTTGIDDEVTSPADEPIEDGQQTPGPDSLQETDEAVESESTQTIPESSGESVFDPEAGDATQTAEDIESDSIVDVSPIHGEDDDASKPDYPTESVETSGDELIPGTDDGYTEETSPGSGADLLIAIPEIDRPDGEGESEQTGETSGQDIGPVILPAETTEEESPKPADGPDSSQASDGGDIAVEGSGTAPTTSGQPLGVGDAEFNDDVISSQASGDALIPVEESSEEIGTDDGQESTDVVDEIIDHIIDVVRPESEGGQTTEAEGQAPGAEVTPIVPSGITGEEASETVEGSGTGEDEPSPIDSKPTGPPTTDEETSAGGITVGSVISEEGAELDEPGATEEELSSTIEGSAADESQTGNELIDGSLVAEGDPFGTENTAGSLISDIESALIDALSDELGLGSGDSMDVQLVDVDGGEQTVKPDEEVQQEPDDGLIPEGIVSVTDNGIEAEGSGAVDEAPGADSADTGDIVQEGASYPTPSGSGSAPTIPGVDSTDQPDSVESIVSVPGSEISEGFGATEELEGSGEAVIDGSKPTEPIADAEEEDSYESTEELEASGLETAGEITEGSGIDVTADVSASTKPITGTEEADQVEISPEVTEDVPESDTGPADDSELIEIIPGSQGPADSVETEIDEGSGIEIFDGSSPLEPIAGPGTSEETYPDSAAPVEGSGEAALDGSEPSDTVSEPESPGTPPGPESTEVYGEEPTGPSAPLAEGASETDAEDKGDAPDSPPAALGAGSCLLNGVTYGSGANVPTSSLCQIMCTCTDSVVQCDTRRCPVAPPGNCRPYYPQGSCCPAYDCSPATEPPIRLQCYLDGEVHEEGAVLPHSDPCKYCLCLSGEVVCATQVCRLPAELTGLDCRPLPAKAGQCCASEYSCDISVLESLNLTTSSTPPGSGSVVVTTPAPQTDGGVTIGVTTVPHEVQTAIINVEEDLGPVDTISAGGDEGETGPTTGAVEGEGKPVEGAEKPVGGEEYPEGSDKPTKPATGTVDESEVVIPEGDKPTEPAVEPAVEPATGDEAVIEEGDKPTEPVVEPADGGETVIEEGDKPTEPAVETVDGGETVIEEGNKPTEPAVEPVDGGEAVIEEGDKPTESTVEPVDGGEAVIEEGDKPTGPVAGSHQEAVDALTSDNNGYPSQQADDQKPVSGQEESIEGVLGVGDQDDGANVEGSGDISDKPTVDGGSQPTAPTTGPVDGSQGATEEESKPSDSTIVPDVDDEVATVTGEKPTVPIAGSHQDAVDDLTSDNNGYPSEHDYGQMPGPGQEQFEASMEGVLGVGDEDAGPEVDGSGDGTEGPSPGGIEKPTESDVEPAEGGEAVIEEGDIPKEPAVEPAVVGETVIEEGDKPTEPAVEPVDGGETVIEEGDKPTEPAAGPAVEPAVEPADGGETVIEEGDKPTEPAVEPVDGGETVIEEGDKPTGPVAGSHQEAVDALTSDNNGYPSQQADDQEPVSGQEESMEGILGVGDQDDGANVEGSGDIIEKPTVDGGSQPTAPTTGPVDGSQGATEEGSKPTDSTVVPDVGDGEAIVTDEKPTVPIAGSHQEAVDDLTSDNNGYPSEHDYGQMPGSGQDEFEASMEGVLGVGDEDAGPEVEGSGDGTEGPTPGGIEKPTESAAEPADGGETVIEDGDKPTEPAVEPVDGGETVIEDGDKPKAPTVVPVDGGEAVIEEGDKPTEPAAGPAVEPAVEPADGGEAVIEEGDKPTEPAVEPVDGGEAVIEEGDKPTGPVAGSHQEAVDALTSNNNGYPSQQADDQKPVSGQEEGIEGVLGVGDQDDGANVEGSGDIIEKPTVDGGFQPTAPTTGPVDGSQGATEEGSKPTDSTVVPAVGDGEAIVTDEKPTVPIASSHQEAVDDLTSDNNGYPSEHDYGQVPGSGQDEFEASMEGVLGVGDEDAGPEVEGSGDGTEGPTPGGIDKPTESAVEPADGGETVIEEGDKPTEPAVEPVDGGETVIEEGDKPTEPAVEPVDGGETVIDEGDKPTGPVAGSHQEAVDALTSDNNGYPSQQADDQKPVSGQEEVLGVGDQDDGANVEGSGDIIEKPTVDGGSQPTAPTTGPIDGSQGATEEGSKPTDSTVVPDVGDEVATVTDDGGETVIGEGDKPTEPVVEPVDEGESVIEEGDKPTDPAAGSVDGIQVVAEEGGKPVEAALEPLDGSQVVTEEGDKPTKPADGSVDGSELVPIDIDAGKETQPGEVAVVLPVDSVGGESTTGEALGGIPGEDPGVAGVIVSVEENDVAPAPESSSSVMDGSATQIIFPGESSTDGDVSGGYPSSGEGDSQGTTPDCAGADCPSNGEGPTTTTVVTSETAETPEPVPTEGDGSTPTTVVASETSETSEPIPTEGGESTPTTIVTSETSEPSEPGPTEGGESTPTTIVTSETSETSGPIPTEGGESTPTTIVTSETSETSAPGPTEGDGSTPTTIVTSETSETSAPGPTEGDGSTPTTIVTSETSETSGPAPTEGGESTPTTIVTSETPEPSEPGPTEGDGSTTTTVVTSETSETSEPGPTEGGGPTATTVVTSETSETSGPAPTEGGESTPTTIVTSETPEPSEPGPTEGDGSTTTTVVTSETSETSEPGPTEGDGPTATTVVTSETSETSEPAPIGSEETGEIPVVPVAGGESTTTTIATSVVSETSEPESAGTEEVGEGPGAPAGGDESTTTTSVTSETSEISVSAPTDGDEPTTTTIVTSETSEISESGPTDGEESVTTTDVTSDSTATPAEGPIDSEESVTTTVVTSETSETSESGPTGTEGTAISPSAPAGGEDSATTTVVTSETSEASEPGLAGTQVTEGLPSSSTAGADGSVTTTTTTTNVVTDVPAAGSSTEVSGGSQAGPACSGLACSGDSGDSATTTTTVVTSETAESTPGQVETTDTESSDSVATCTGSTCAVGTDGSTSTSTTTSTVVTTETVAGQQGPTETETVEGTATGVACVGVDCPTGGQATSTTTTTTTTVTTGADGEEVVTVSETTDVTEGATGQPGTGATDEIAAGTGCTGPNCPTGGDGSTTTTTTTTTVVDTEGGTEIPGSTSTQTTDASTQTDGACVGSNCATGVDVSGISGTTTTSTTGHGGQYVQGGFIIIPGLRVVRTITTTVETETKPGQSLSGYITVITTTVKVTTVVTYPDGRTTTTTKTTVSTATRSALPSEIAALNAGQKPDDLVNEKVVTIITGADGKNTTTAESSGDQLPASAAQLADSFSGDAALSDGTPTADGSVDGTQTVEGVPDGQQTVGETIGASEGSLCGGSVCGDGSTSTSGSTTGAGTDEVSSTTTTTSGGQYVQGGLIIIPGLRVVRTITTTVETVTKPGQSLSGYITVITTTVKVTTVVTYPDGRTTTTTKTTVSTATRPALPSEIAALNAGQNPDDIVNEKVVTIITGADGKNTTTTESSGDQLPASAAQLADSFSGDAALSEGTPTPDGSVDGTQMVEVVPDGQQTVGETIGASEGSLCGGSVCGDGSTSTSGSTTGAGTDEVSSTTTTTSGGQYVQGGLIIIPGLRVVRTITTTVDTVTKPGQSLSGYITVITTTVKVTTVVTYPDGRTTTTTKTTVSTATRPAFPTEIAALNVGQKPDDLVNEKIVTIITGADGKNTTTTETSGDPLPASAAQLADSFSGDAALSGTLPVFDEGVDGAGGQNESQLISVTDEVLDMLANGESEEVQNSTDITDEEVNGASVEENLIDGDSTDGYGSTSSSSTSTSTSTTTSTEILLGPGACLFDGKVYVSAQQIPRDNPCDFCFCFRGDIICLQQSCPPPVSGCVEQPIEGFCCPRYECSVDESAINQTSVEPTTEVAPLVDQETAKQEPQICEIQGSIYQLGQVVEAASGPCLECRCGSNGMMSCEPKRCQPQTLLKKMMIKAAERKR